MRRPASKRQFESGRWHYKVINSVFAGNKYLVGSAQDQRLISTTLIRQSCSLRRPSRVNRSVEIELDETRRHSLHRAERNVGLQPRCGIVHEKAVNCIPPRFISELHSPEAAVEEVIPKAVPAEGPPASVAEPAWITDANAVSGQLTRPRALHVPISAADSGTRGFGDRLY
jgi:hypothetical protein